MMDLSQLLGMGSTLGNGQPGQDQPDLMDTAETVHISPLALLKMLKHGRAGVPLEVMGLMLGEFVDDFTVRVVDVFAMPQSGTGVSVEAVDPVFQTRMVDMLKQVGRPETVVGWYHSHPGFGPWLSSVDVSTQGAFEALNKRAVAVVIDPIQSVRGKVVIDAFRTIPARTAMMQREPRQTTSNLGYLHKPSLVALIHGLNRHYYSIGISYLLSLDEQRALLNISSPALSCSTPNSSPQFDAVGALVEMAGFADGYARSLREESALSEQQKKARHVGKRDPRRHLQTTCESLINAAILRSFNDSVSAIVG
jgi:26S proteasome regulatory subunit N11